MTDTPPPTPVAPKPGGYHRLKRKRRRRHYPTGEEKGLGHTWVMALILALLATSVAVLFLFYGPQILKWLAWPFGE
jgi:hypothetical protein